MVACLTILHTHPPPILDSGDEDPAVVKAEVKAEVKPVVGKVKTPKAAPAPRAKRLTPRKSPATPKARQKTLKQSLKSPKETVTLTAFFGTDPIKRTQRPSSSTTTDGTKPPSHTPSGGPPPSSGARLPSQSNSSGTSEVMVIPESPTLAEEGMMGEELDDTAFAQFLQVEELEKAKLEVRDKLEVETQNSMWVLIGFLFLSNSFLLHIKV